MAKLYGCIQRDTLSVYVFIFGFSIVIIKCQDYTGKKKPTFLSNVQVTQSTKLLNAGQQYIYNRGFTQSVFPLPIKIRSGM